MTDTTMAQVILPLEEFAAELDNLGRANGNIYYRIPGVEGLHDGQVMVRLKKQRFVILDYSIQPNEADVQAADENPHIKIPNNAGKAICTKANCNKIGVPVCLYDSEPLEPDPLYLRHGLCFQCQRNLNEQRRTERKKPSKMGRDSQPSLIYAIGPSNKKFKIDGGTIHLKNDAIIINGAVEGTKHFEEGYGFQEIGYDLLSLTQEAARETVRLVNAVNGNTATAAVEAVAALGPPDHDYRPSGSNSLEQRGSGVPPATNEDINALYYKTFQSMNKSIFLLSQWKSSWESTMSAASNTVADASLAEAVASAAAVVAAASSSTSLAGPEADQGQDQNNPSMVSLLLAADKSNDSVSEMATAVAEHVQDQVDWPMQPEVQARYYQQDTGEGDASDDACEYAV